MYSTMGELRLGKASTVFENRARELGALVLANKKNQETRFVRLVITASNILKYRF